MSEAIVLDTLATQYAGVAVLLLVGWAAAVAGRPRGARTTTGGTGAPAPGAQQAARQAQRRRREAAMVLIKIRRSR